MANEDTFNQQIAVWRQQRRAAETQAAVDNITREYAEVKQQRDLALQRKDAQSAELYDQDCERLEHEYAQYVPPQPQQMDPRLQRFQAKNKDYIDRLIQRYGNEKASAFLNAVHQRLIAPRNLQDPSKGGMGLQIYSPEYFQRGRDFLELYSEGASGIPYEQTPRSRLMKRLKFLA